MELNDRQIAEFFRRSYSTVDGLWFLKVEEKYGFDQALEVDDEVWKVLPKIQARILKSICGKTGGLEALQECLETKFKMDEFKFSTENDNNKILSIIIKQCPWHNLMVKSGRQHLSGRVGTRVCNSEYSVWAAVFDTKLTFSLEKQICQNDECCILRFKY